MKKILFALLILTASIAPKAQNSGNLKAVYNKKGVQTQLISFESIVDWGYDNETKEIFVNLRNGSKLTFSSNDFFQFEFIESGLITKETFSGRVQKGPYVNGSSVSIIELDENMNQTGNVFSTEIIDNGGNFEKKNLEFTSGFIELKADGYYFNEVRKQTSNGPLTLYSLTDVTELNSANINIITHLERARIKFLMEDEALTFAEAKNQARNEILNLFTFTLPENMLSESLDITENAILLAISSIIQGSLSTGDMSELLANISSDIRRDGVLDNSVLGSRLINNAAYLDAAQIVSNMQEKYAGLGVASNVSADDLNRLIEHFIHNCGFEQTAFITYPESGKYGLNILADDFIKVKKNVQYSMKALLPAGNSSLKIILKNNLATWGGCNIITIENWFCGTFDNETRGNTFSVSDNEKPNDLGVVFFSDCTVEYYENGASEPTKTKVLKMEIEP